MRVCFHRCVARWMVVSALAGAVFILATAPAFSAAILSVGEVDSQSGIVPVGFRGDATVAAMQLDVLFDPAAYAAASAATGTLPDSYRVDSYLIEPGRLRVVVGAANNAALTDSTVFNVPLNATNGFNTGFPVVLTNLALSTAQSTAVTSQLAPQVRLLNLTSGGRVNANGGVQLAVEAGAIGGSVSRVEFFINGQKIGQSTTAPFSLAWTPTASGQYVLQVIAYDSNGLQTASRSIPVAVFFNRPPTVRPVTLGTNQNTPVSIPLAKLLAFASDPDGDSLVIAAAGPATAYGGTATLGSNALNYSPPADYIGFDSFTFTVSDGIDGTAVGTVSVTVSAAGKPVTITRTATGYLLRLNGTPGAYYNVQFQNKLDGPNPWATLNSNGPIQAGTDGVFQFEDHPDPTLTSRYYRIIQVQ